MLRLPKDFVDFSDARKQGFIRMKELKESGKKVVGIFCSYTPMNWFDHGGRCHVNCALRGQWRRHCCGRKQASQEPVPVDQGKLRFGSIRDLPILLFFGYDIGGDNLWRKKENVWAAWWIKARSCHAIAPGTWRGRRFGLLDQRDIPRQGVYGKTTWCDH